MAILFPGCHGNRPIAESRMETFYNVQLRSIAALLAEQIENAFRYECHVEKRSSSDNCGEKAADAFCTAAFKSV